MLKPYTLPQEALPALYRDYLNNVPQALELLGRHAEDEQVFEQTAKLVAAAYQGERRQLAELLLAYNRELGGSAKTLEKAKQLADPAAVAVLTGQQAGLCGGPLYNVYKAIAAVKLADNLEKKLGRPVVPVFWVASEDHNFSEADHFWLLDRENRLRRINLELAHRGEPVGRLPLPESAVRQVIGKIAELVRESEFSGDLLATLSETGKASATPAEWFARFFAALFAEAGLVCFDPLLSQAKRILTPFFVEVAARQAEIKETLQTIETRLLTAGYPLQVKREENASLLMWMGEQRKALYFRNGRFTSRDGAVSFSPADLRELALAAPEQLSPNVLLRPLVQDRLFPTAAYLPGPGELGYFAQLLPLYRLFGICSPVLLPRAGLTIIEPRLARYIRRYDIPEENLLAGLDRTIMQTLVSQDSVDIDTLFARLHRQIREEYDVLRQELARLDGALANLAAKNLEHVFAEVAYLQKAAREKSREKNEVMLRHFTALQQALMPMGVLQERVLNIIPFLCKYGPTFWHKLQQEFPLTPGHYLFYS